MGNGRPKLIMTITDVEFEKGWTEVYNEFITKNKYEEAKKIMVDYFKNVRCLGK